MPTNDYIYESIRVVKAKEICIFLQKDHVHPHNIKYRLSRDGNSFLLLNIFFKMDFNIHACRCDGLNNSAKTIDFIFSWFARMIQSMRFKDFALLTLYDYILLSNQPPAGRGVLIRSHRR